MPKTRRQSGTIFKQEFENMIMYNNRIWPTAHRKETEKMAVKIAALIFGSLNVFLYVFAWFSNLDNTKSTILFIVALCMSMYRFYRWGINSIQNKRLKDLFIREKEIELEERSASLIKRHHSH